MSGKVNVNGGMVGVISRNYVAYSRLLQAAVALKIGMVEDT